MQPQANTVTESSQSMQPQNLQRSSQRTGPALLPPVDIFEDAGGITLLADLPGVAREDLAIGVDGRNLTIEAPVQLGDHAADRISLDLEYGCAAGEPARRHSG